MNCHREVSRMILAWLIRGSTEPTAQQVRPESNSPGRVVPRGVGPSWRERAGQLASGRRAGIGGRHGRDELSAEMWGGSA